MTWDLDAFISKLYERELLPEQVVKELCEKTKEVLVTESNVKAVAAPCTLVGDVHGQFYDVLEIFKIGGYSPNTNYVFLGDYVDRGYFSVETITLLTCLKLRYPSRVTLVRGNHECRTVTQTYGFYAECIRKYGNANVWSYFTDMFDYLVLAVIIEDAIFGVHGGLSPSIHTIDQIRIIDRFREIPHEGPMADLVWSDPMAPTFPGGLPGSEDKGDFAISPRGAGYVFGKDVTRKFLEINGLGHICRAHQLCMEGYQILYDDMLSTVWSAPNYCYRAGNMASVLEISPYLERFFNVFGPCPDQHRELPSSRDEGGQPTLSNLLGLDGEAETASSGSSSSGVSSNTSNGAVMSNGNGGGGNGDLANARRRRRNFRTENVVAADGSSEAAGNPNITKVVNEYFL
ncbi:hypothetical protein SmJEL517_g00042 [Synchytrium microbalum]|uniref:Serine/threonine-protein phosphatase n=1 Tax=Synchytrium microbalum TaxID=1806994 RepID=A0A507CJN0_9FUNG|nr:uncharacterized protein SmJEL517_g00042 [Synchytrium microbalum]TPX38035.1 hypothetical protein SmJEL517_g00042 [Synchytrium microbalum]